MIVVIGSINMDLVMRVPRMPHPGETLSGGQFQTIPGGKGANQAVACARLSRERGQVAMIACLGDDAFGTELRASLRHDDIDDTHVHTIPGMSSGVAAISVDATGQNSILLAAGANDALSPAHIDAARDLIRLAKVVVLQLETPMATIRHAIQLAHAFGKIVVLNPAPAQALPVELLNQLSYLIPNEIEAGMLAGRGPSSLVGNTEIDAVIGELRSLGCTNVLVTLGAKGVRAALADGIQHFAAQPTLAIDTTAAGDTFIGGFVAALADGEGEADAINFGQRAAALSVGRIGAQTSIPYRRELLQTL
ncbi:ribokinase [Glaciimonas sp. PAMC28666]|uniref:ribokinase n=1 Tax=Glaciimonas sp. PAMC28666 TaxID=2807626 RepID=UPI001965E5B9|nr:ribokinase [Glaciimonas sp. PAMC28666]QRX84003.1 ribokinase [Glaciimonas sp. PAMC28666]